VLERFNTTPEAVFKGFDMRNPNRVDECIAYNNKRIEQCQEGKGNS
jgi:hypothetical protein